ncbi:aminopeptidase N [Kineosphaera limosa]|uniref:Aminopeptidase N n=1 Tax=Kineosphaera limosa NBRC 100340 TaxID=1184609 RepID=K6WK16_9MICO|nr:aminopeptidase N [Kineosphaera limosa]NYE02286.1 aminopeptidase N [Kineosphaera limosa]GAB94141.1 aminopeptidase N [Kineosphaera limosa NBRC 100340]
MGSLTVEEARERARLLDVTGYQVELDLDRGAQVFGSVTRIAFDCREPGAATFLDVRAVELGSVMLNGRELDPTTCVDGRLPLLDLAASNVVQVEATMAYRHDGEGLHRATDPADGNDYVYAMTFLDAAPTVFACFDQPDLKAPYEVQVRVPQDWSVLGNGAAKQVGPGEWALERTQPLATYFVTVCAGPWVSVRAEHRGIDLGWHARASVAAELREQVDELLEVTRDGLDYFERLFGIDYPFGPSYDQVLVPEFNAGAMENPGCVTYSEHALHRGAATLAQRRGRANTILHEMAHMWFGDLVTMRWWDDLWLNESFAEYMAHRAQEAIGRFEGAWAEFGISRKAWGYAAERRPSTHPVAANPAPDAASALQNFDGISYAKGACVLRQLIAYVDDGPFIAGVRDHLHDHAHGNADLADFLDAVGAASGLDLRSWAQAWLRSAGRDELAVEIETRQDEKTGEMIREARLWRTPPMGEWGELAADRPHALDIAGFTDGQQVWRIDVRALGDETLLPGLTGRPAPALVLPNAADLTWADVRLDAASAVHLPRQLPPLHDPLARVVTWVALADAVVQGATPPDLYLETLVAALPTERDSGVVAMLGRVAGSLATSYFADEQGARTRIARAGHLLLERLGDAQAADATEGVEAAERASLRLAALRIVASATDDVALLRTWLAGEGAADGLGADRDFGWLCLTALARLGAAGETQIEERLAADSSLDGHLAALAARAAIPTAAAKAQAWDVLVGRPEGGGASNSERLHTGLSFWRCPDLDLVRPYVPRYAQELPELAGVLGEYALGRVAEAAFPHAVTEAHTAEVIEAALQRPDLAAAVRRSFADGLADLRYALVSRSRY